MNDDGPNTQGVIDGKTFNGRLEEWAELRDSSEFMVREVRMTGGEPLLYPDAVNEIARCCTRLNIKSGINTNGVLLDRPLLLALKKSGLAVMKISLDPLNDPAAIPRSEASLFRNKILRGIENACREGFKVILRQTLSRYTQDEVIHNYRRGQTLGVHEFQVKPLIKAGRGAFSDAFLSQDGIVSLLQKLEQASSGQKLGVEVLCWPPRLLSSLSFKICGSMNKVYIFPSLKVGLCNFVSQAIPYGDLSSETLETVLRQRPGAVWSNRGGYCLLEGCPNKIYFEDSADH